MRDYGPGCNLKALYLCENKRLPAALLPSRPPPPPPSPPRPPAPVAAYLRLLIRGCGDHKPGQKKHERLGKESALLRGCRPACFTPHRGQRKTASLFRRIKKIWLCKLKGEPGNERPGFFFCRAPCCPVETWKWGCRTLRLCQPKDSQCFQSLLTIKTKK